MTIKVIKNPTNNKDARTVKVIGASEVRKEVGIAHFTAVLTLSVVKCLLRSCLFTDQNLLLLVRVLRARAKQKTREILKRSREILLQHICRFKLLLQVDY